MLTHRKKYHTGNQNTPLINTRKPEDPATKREGNSFLEKALQKKKERNQSGQETGLTIAILFTLGYILIPVERKVKFYNV